MFTISGVHRRAISAIEWSRNGMRLFTGDEEGQVSTVHTIVYFIMAYIIPVYYYMYTVYW